MAPQGGNPVTCSRLDEAEKRSRAKLAHLSHATSGAGGPERGIVLSADNACSSAALGGGDSPPCL